MAGSSPAMTKEKTCRFEHQFPRPCARRLRTVQWRKGAITMTSKPELCRLTILAAASALLATLALTMLAGSPALADRCDDLAGQLKSQIDGVAIGRTAAN